MPLTVIAVILLAIAGVIQFTLSTTAGILCLAAGVLAAIVLLEGHPGLPWKRPAE